MKQAGIHVYRFFNICISSPGWVVVLIYLELLYGFVQVEGGMMPVVRVTPSSLISLNPESDGHIIRYVVGNVKGGVMVGNGL
ncbi:hypothetical protein ES703_93785 [subsurface metagenome]